MLLGVSAHSRPFDKIREALALRTLDLCIAEEIDGLDLPSHKWLYVRMGVLQLQEAEEKARQRRLVQQEAEEEARQRRLVPERRIRGAYVHKIAESKKRSSSENK